MDPNAAIQRSIDGLVDNNLQDGFGGWLDYLDWTAKGGFEADPEILASFDTAVGDWSIRTGITPADFHLTAVDVRLSELAQ